MELNKLFILTLDRVRKEKKVTINELTEGIISERTYRRYVNDDGVINLTILLKLINKLNVRVTDLIFYLLTNFSQYQDYKKMLMSLYTGAYESCDDELKLLSNYHSHIEEIDNLVKIYVKRFQYGKELISQAEYRLFLGELLPFYMEMPLDNIYALSYLTLYYEEFPENNFISLNDLANRYAMEFSNKQRALLYLIASDRLLRMIENNNVDIENYEELVRLFTVAAYISRDVHFTNDAKFHKALLYHRLNDNDKFEECLFKYLMGKIQLRKENEFDKERDFIQNLLGIDIIQFQKSYFYKKKM